jgi:hypothetical protein
LAVRTGEHEGFTRLVVSTPAGTPWELQPTAEGYELGLPPGFGFDLSRAFTPISRARVADLVPAGPGRALARPRLRLPRGDLSRRAEPRHRRAGRAAPTGEMIRPAARPPAGPPAGPAVEPDAAPEAEAPAVAADDAGPDTLVEAMPDAAADAARDAIVEGFMQAAAMGLLDVAAPAPPTASPEPAAIDLAPATEPPEALPVEPAAPEAAGQAALADPTHAPGAHAPDDHAQGEPASDGHAEDDHASDPHDGPSDRAAPSLASPPHSAATGLAAPPADPASADLARLDPAPADAAPADATPADPPAPAAAEVPAALAGRPGVSLRTGLDGALADRPPPLAADGDPCLPPEAFDLAAWAPSGDYGREVPARSAALFTERDLWAEGAVEDLARTLLAFGFGREAAQALRSDGRASAGRDVLLALAALVDGEAAPPGALADQGGCVGPVALWRALARGTIEGTDAAERTSMTVALRALPDALRGHLGVALAGLFLDAGDPVSAEAIMAGARAELTGGGTVAGLAEAAVAEATAGPAAAITDLAALAEADPRMTPAGVLRLIDLSLEEGRAVDDATLLLAQSLRLDNPADAPALVLAQARGLAAGLRFDEALALLAEEGALLPPAEADAATDAVVASLLERLGDAEVLDWALSRRPDRLPSQACAPSRPGSTPWASPPRRRRCGPPAARRPSPRPRRRPGPRAPSRRPWVTSGPSPAGRPAGLRAGGRPRRYDPGRAPRGPRARGRGARPRRGAAGRAARRVRGPGVASPVPGS